jgi:hypothetical protein
MADVNIKAKLSVDTTEADKGISNIKGNLKGASDTAKAGGADFSKLKDTIGQLGPAGDMATKQMGALNQAFNVLKANPIILVIGILVGVVVALFEKFKQMEAVSDALGKAFGTLSGILNRFVTAILTPMIEGFVKLVDVVVGSVVKAMEFLGLASEGVADRFGEITEALDDLEDAEKNQALALAESNRKMQEAREVAQDANVPIKERVEALKEASKIEKEELDRVVKINQQKASLMLESIALEVGARDGLIQKIKEGSLESLKAARNELMSMGNIDKSKLAEIDKMIIAAEDAAAQSSKIARKTQVQITSLEKEEQSKREAEHKAYLERKRKAEEEAAKKEEAIYREKMKEFERLEGINIKSSKVRQVDLTQSSMATLEERATSGIKSINKQREADEQAKKNEIFWADESKKKAEEERDAKVNAARASGEALVALADIVGRQTIAGKALATAQALINTYLGVTEVIKNRTILPEPAGTIQKIASVATILASGFSAVRNITKTQVPGGGGGSAPAQSITAAAPITPQAGSMQLNTATIQGIGNAAAGGVNRAYVLDADVNNQSERQARLHRAARLA